MIKKQYVLGFMTDDSDNVLLIKKTKPEWQNGFLNGIGGKIELVNVSMFENYEWPEDAMVREFKEETGIETTKKQWRLVTTAESSNFYMYVYHTHVPDIFELNPRTTTEEEVSIVTIHRVGLEKVLPSARSFLYMCRATANTFTFIGSAIPYAVAI